MAISYSNIGATLESQGKYDDALGYHQKAVAIQIKVLGRGHPDVISAYKNIAIVLEHLGKKDFY